MKRFALVFAALVMVFASAAAQAFYTLYDTESGGVYTMETDGVSGVMVGGEYAGCSFGFDDTNWAYRVEKEEQETLMYTDMLHECPNPASAVTVYSPLIGGAMPQSLEDVARINRATTLLPQSQTFSVIVKEAGSGTLPVYAAPGKDAYRAANGKAAVGLGGEIIVLDWRDGYMLVFYEIGGGKARVGYVQERREIVSALAEVGVDETLYENGVHRWGRMPAKAAHSTPLTDNPNSTGDVLTTLEEGEAFTCLGRWGSLYAYVETQIAGKTARGFVPLKDVEIPEPQEDQEAMAQLAGTSWAFYAGGSMFADFMHCRADSMVMGGYYNYDDGYGFPEEPEWDLEERMISQWEACAYSVCRYDPAWGLFWADVPYMITCTRGNGAVSRYGLRFDEDSLSLFTEEGSGGFIPYVGSMDAVPGAEE